MERPFADKHAVVQASAVAAVQVANEDAVVLNRYLAMMSTYQRAGQSEIAIIGTADEEKWRIDSDRPQLSLTNA
jgi:hypothetical protein